MSDVALVALFSGSATVLVAICGLLGTIFGPARAERVRAEKELAREATAREENRRAERFRRAEEFSEAIITAIGAGDWSTHADEDAARIRFIAVLNAGEGPVAKYVGAIGDGLEDIPNSFDRKEEALSRMERVFDYLRGDISVDMLSK